MLFIQFHVIFNNFDFQSRSEVEKTKRKLENDLRCTQETLTDLERSKNEMAQVMQRILYLQQNTIQFDLIFQAVQRKEKEMAAIAAKIEDEQSLGSKMQKQVKELGVSY